jgi:hypothetical protein
MAIETANIRNAIVYRSADYPHRWYDAFGEGVIKHLQEFVTIPQDDTTLDPSEWVVTVVEIGGGTSNLAIADVAGGAATVTCAANENDGWSMQLGPVLGECIDLSGPYYLYVSVDMASNDADQTDVLVGVAVTDTALLGGVTDGIYFRSVDETTNLEFVTEKDSVESSTVVGTLADAAYTRCEFLVDESNVKAYVNGVLMSTTARTAATFPNDELMRLSLEFLTGEAVANVLTIKHLKMIHIR